MNEGQVDQETVATCRIIICISLNLALQICLSLPLPSMAVGLRICYGQIRLRAGPAWEKI